MTVSDKKDKVFRAFNKVKLFNLKTQSNFYIQNVTPIINNNWKFKCYEKEKHVNVEFLLSSRRQRWFNVHFQKERNYICCKNFY